MAASTLSAWAMPPLAWTVNSGKESLPKFDVVAIDKARILKAAARYLGEVPVTITAFPASRSAGGRHDYYSEGDYWWPDPKNPSGPYIDRDGMTNPANFTAHRHALIRLSLQVPALAAAWFITRDERYAQHALLHLSAWFIDPATLMNPNLQFAQAIHGVTTGRGIGIIDTVHLVEVARAAAVLENSASYPESQRRAVKNWFAQYVDWMTTSKNGIQEREAKNNHGTCWVMQVAEFARFTGKPELTDYCRTRFKTVLLLNQMAPNGSFPLELRRTKPYGYSLFNLDAMATVCQVLSTQEENLFRYNLSDGRGMGRAMSFMAPYIAHKNTWPYRHDVMYFDQWPIRQPSLLFAGLALSRPDYVALWRKLNPDSTVEEVIRNCPIRQPVLWVSAEA